MTGTNESTVEQLADGTPAELVDVLEHRRHPELRTAVRELETLVRAAEQLHGPDRDYPRGLAGQVEVLAIDLLDHMEKEERVLFPAVRRGLSVELTPPIRVIRREHEDLLESLTEVEHAVAGYTASGGDLAPSWAAFRTAFEAFSALLQAQITIEEQVLFPRLLA